MSKPYFISVFDDEQKLLAGIKAAKDKNVKIDEIYTPYPMHEVIEAMGKKSRFTFAAFVYGFLAVISILSFLYYTSVIDWPINYGGKPTSAFPSFIIITLVLTIASITILSLFTFSIRAKIYPGKKYIMPDLRATDDKFIMVFEEENSGSKFEDLNKMLMDCGAEEVYKKEL
ncbi:MAG: DUF3341 domain-containing protein [Bacteroidetes bacterium]|nr:DUF3341 domain-containing protein [Bacteroidota bacterium]